MARNNDLFVNVLETLKNDILSGKYPFQSKIPSETYLARELNISRTTLRKVLEALKDAGLIESQKGSGWFVCNKNITRYIPIVMPKNSNNYRMTEIFEGAHNYFDSVGFSSLLTITDDDPEKEQELLNKLFSEGHNNFVIYPTSSFHNSAFYQKLLRKNCNFVFIDSLPERITCDYVTSCNFLGGYMATKKLITLGHKNIAFCSLPNPETTNTIKDRYLGYLSALEQNKIKHSEDLIFIHGDEDYSEFCNRILKNTAATAIFASTDEFAIQLSKMFADSDRHPAIIGFDNTILSETFDLASVNQNLYEIGKTSAELLYKRIVNPQKNYEHIFVPVSLIERGSLTKPEKNRD